MEILAANITKRKDGRYMGKFIVGYDDIGKAQYQYVYGRTYDEAESKMLIGREVASRYLSGRYITVSKVYSEWLNAVVNRVKESTFANYKAKFEKHILPEFADIPCADLSVGIINEFINKKLTDGLSASYVRDIFTVFKSMLKYAQEEYGFKLSLKNVVLPKAEKKQIVKISDTEQKRLVSYLRDNMSLTAFGILISLFMGLRIGELCGLKWSDVDFDNKILHIRRTVQRISLANGSKNPDNWRLLKDTDGDQLPDCVEQFIGTDATLVDSDSDMLDDYYEVFVTGTDPVLPDTDNNGVADGDEDFDTDVLTNYQEYVQGTSPWDSDSDCDELSDGDEVNIYNTNPLEPDTDFDGLSDSDEVTLGTNPNLPDTNGDGTLDGQERFDQTYVYDVSAEDCAVEQVIVSMEGTGNLQNTMSIDNIMDKDVICSGVVGLVGVPFSIETTSDFETATLSFKIDQSKLGDTDFNDLLFLWYDEDNYQFVELETNYDEENSLVSIQTTHFSRYMVVDKYQWFEAWAVTFDYNPGEEGTHGEPDVYHNTVLAIDCSGSMDSYDRISIRSGIDSPYEALHRYTCQRIEAATQFIQNMNSIDKSSVVLFTSSASTAQSMTDNKEDLKLSLQNITSSGGTSFYAALIESYNAFEENTIGAYYTNNRIILLSDGEDGDYTNTISLLNSIYGENSNDNRKSIKIYTIGLGSSYDSRLEEIATISHGEFFKAYTASDLVDIYTEIGIGGDFDTTDTDGDGLYDAVETAGIRIQNGMVLKNNPETDIFFSNPTVSDTDHDGLKDGEEIDPTIRRKHTYWCAPEITVDGGYYFFMKSDPSCQDSDGDGIVDNYCESTKNTASYGFSDPNPLTSDVTKTALKHDFFSIDYEYKDGVEKDWKDNNSGSNESYGGYQGWFGRYGYTKDMKIFCNQSVTGLEIHNNGCGIIALGDMLLYMAIGDPTYNPTMDWSIPTMMYLGSSYNHIDFDTYVWYIYTISNYFSYLPFIKGLAGDGLLFSNLENGLKLMSLNNSGSSGMMVG